MKQDDAAERSKGGELLPIDIYYNKLLDWLLDRRHCEVRWQTAVFQIREKINVAIQDMPPVDEITQLLSGTYINYFHCLRIVELLKISEHATKNIFGGYSSKRMKDWQEIVKLYEKNNVNLAEAAHLLIRNVNYEIPSLKRQIAKSQLTQRECTRKENEYSSNAALFKDKYQSVCRQMGIKGEQVKSELLSLLDELPEIYERIAVSISGLKDATRYYGVFVNFLVPSYNPGPMQQTTPLLRHIQQHGNTTVYQWRTGKIPLVVVPEKKPDISAIASSETENIEEIDWGSDTFETDVASDTTNPAEGTQEESAAIDWGEDSDAVDWGESVDWGEEGTGKVEVTLQNGGNEGITVEESGEDKGVVSGKDAASLMDDTNTRNLLIDELLELQGFLRQRIEEMKSGSDVLSANQFQSAPQLIQLQSVEAIQAMEASVGDIISTLTSMKMHNLFLLKTSPRYLDRLADSLQQKLRVADKMVTSCKNMIDKRQVAAEEQRGLEPKLEVIRNKTKELRGQLEQEISNKYKNRPVNIMGEINTI